MKKIFVLVSLISVLTASSKAVPNHTLFGGAGTCIAGSAVAYYCNKKITAIEKKLLHQNTSLTLQLELLKQKNVGLSSNMAP